MKVHTSKIALLACALAALTSFGTAGTAKAGDTVVMGTDRNTGGEAAGDRATLDSIRQQMRDQRNASQR